MFTTTKRAFISFKYPIYTTRFFSSSNIEVEFLKAKDALMNGPKVEEPSNEIKLRIYGLFKQSTAGPCDDSVTVPGMFDPIGRAKYMSWKSYKDMHKDTAMKEYTNLIYTIIPKESVTVSTPLTEVNDTVQPIIRQTDFSNKTLLNQICYPRNQNGLESIEHHKTIKTTVSNSGVATVKLDRTNKKNAFNMQMWLELKETFEAITNDNKVKVVILTGDSGSFSTGMDLQVFADLNSGAKDEKCEGRQREAIGHLIQFLQDGIAGPEKCPVPVIAAISGYCIGGAVDLVTACDMRYCVNDSIFSIKETDLAMVADIGTLQRLPKLIGDSQARELAYTGRDFYGIEAEKIGLVLKSFPCEVEMLKHVHTTAELIAEKSPLTIRGAKTTLLYTRDHTVEESLLQVKMHNQALLMSSDLLEAMRASMMKDKPVFTGN
jgi:enoyl-CoA hydratase